jgi:hypothetical protein
MIAMILNYYWPPIADQGGGGGLLEFRIAAEVLVRPTRNRRETNLETQE